MLGHRVGWNALQREEAGAGANKLAVAGVTPSNRFLMALGSAVTAFGIGGEALLETMLLSITRMTPPILTRAPKPGVTPI
jgi:hypothetical protein